jgi:glycosyltransferase involved in cell wall biosynthesis
MDEEDFPLVSAIMLAGKVSVKDIQITIDCFKSQTYPNKELIIVNNCPTQYQAADLNIYAQRNVFVLDTPVLLRAGMARNFGINAANGRIIVQFDPDFYHMPKRIETQLTTLANHEAGMCVLTETLSYSFVSAAARRHSNSLNAILNTMIFIRPKGIDYADQEKQEEKSLADQFNKAGAKIVSLAEPSLMVKLFTTNIQRRFDPKNLADLNYTEMESIQATVDAYKSLEQ